MSTRKLFFVHAASHESSGVPRAEAHNRRNQAVGTAKRGSWFRAAVNWAGVNWAGVNWAGVNWAGVNWAGVNWAGVK